MIATISTSTAPIRAAQPLAAREHDSPNKGVSSSWTRFGRMSTSARTPDAVPATMAPIALCTRSPRLSLQPACIVRPHEKPYPFQTIQLKLLVSR